MRILRIITSCLILTLMSIKVAESSLYMSAWDAMEPVNRLRRPVPELGNASVVDVLFPNSNIFSLITVDSRVLHLISENNMGVEEKTYSCHHFMHNFSKQAAAFTRCLLNYARPFRLCEHCVKDYTRTRHLYQMIQNDSVCSQRLLLSDSIDTIDTIYSAVTNVWSTADCDKCFLAVWENDTTGEVDYNFTRNTLSFINIINNLTICFNSSIEIYLEESGSLPRNITVCNDCRSQYRRLNSHFETMWSESNGHICMDLIDMMNYTRLMWSAKFHCRRPDADATVLIIITVLMAFLTILLYLVCRFSAEIRKIQIVKTKRMRNKRSYGAIKQSDMESSVSSVPGSLSSHRVCT